MSNWNINPDTPLDELWARWITETATERDPETNELYLTTYGARHLAPYFKTIGQVSQAASANYIRERLKVVKKTTVTKELSALRGFLAWCEEQGYVEHPPIIPKPPRRALGTPFAVRRRGKPTELAPDQVKGVINRLPECSSSKRVAPFPIRSRFVVAYETALRPATLDALSVPEHYTKGAAYLTITDEIDKARYGRSLPLSDEARAALDAVVPERGLIFGCHDYRDQLKKAAEGVLTPAELATFAAYDFRHARITELAEQGHLTGAAYIAGHKKVSTTDHYARPNRRAADRALKAVGPTGFVAATANPVTRRNRLAGVPNPADHQALCEGEDLNLHGSYPASTSS